MRQALHRQHDARPVDEDGFGQRLRPARVPFRQPRRVGGGEDEADLVEAKQDLELGDEADFVNRVTGAVGDAQGKSDEALLPPLGLPALN